MGGARLTLGSLYRVADVTLHSNMLEWMEVGRSSHPRGFAGRGVMGVVVPYVKDGLSCAVVDVTVGLVSLLYYIHIRI